MDVTGILRSPDPSQPPLDPREEPAGIPRSLGCAVSLEKGGPRGVRASAQLLLEGKSETIPIKIFKKIKEKLLLKDLKEELDRLSLD